MPKEETPLLHNCDFILPTPHLRFVMRDGKRILQQYMSIETPTKGLVRNEWRDVELVEDAA